MTDLTDLNVTSFAINGVAQTATPAEVNVLAGVTAGTVTASKAVVVDSNKDIATFRHITLSGNLVVGATTISETDIAKVDAITNGTVTASKALVVDANKDLSSLRNLTLEGFLANSVTNTITAFATGGQASAVALTTGFNRITVCATNGDSVKLPAATAGKSVYVKNNGAAYAAVFPATGEAIDTLAANMAVSLPSGADLYFRCVVAGTWESTKLTANGKYATGTTTTTFAAGQLTGGFFTVYKNTQGTPGSIATRTAAEMFTDNPYARVGGTYILRVANGQGTGTLTITAGSGVTLTGTAAIAANTFNDYLVTYTSATALVMQDIGQGIYA